MDLLPVLVSSMFFLGVVLAIIFYVNERESVKIKEAFLSERMNIVSNGFRLFTLSSVPGVEIKSTIGFVRGVSKTAIYSNKIVDIADKEAMIDIIERSSAMGANAIVGLSFCSQNYDATANGGQQSHVVYIGTAVII